MREEYPHFRYQRHKNGHPAFVLRENKDNSNKYDYRDCTHTKSSSNKYRKIKSNPDGGNKPMYIKLEVDTKPKKNFRKDKLKFDINKVHKDLWK